MSEKRGLLPKPQQTAARSEKRVERGKTEPEFIEQTNLFETWMAVNYDKVKDRIDHCRGACEVAEPNGARLAPCHSPEADCRDKTKE